MSNARSVAARSGLKIQQIKIAENCTADGRWLVLIIDNLFDIERIRFTITAPEYALSIPRAAQDR